MTKKKLRQIYLAKRRVLSAAEVDEKSRRIRQLFFEKVMLDGIRAVHCFLSIQRFNEVETSGIISELWSTKPEVRVAVPKLNEGSGEMESLLYGPETPLAAGQWGILEPAVEMPVAPEDIDLVLIPSLAFDTAGHRVGYGKGYYDRFLSRCRRDCVKAGLNFFPPSEPITDIHQGDIPLDLCITPDAVYRMDQAAQGMTADR